MSKQRGTGWHGELWNFDKLWKKTIEHSSHWIMTGWDEKQWNFQNNVKKVGRRS
jgi:hypothetical protein